MKRMNEFSGIVNNAQWSAKVDAKEKELQSEQYRKEHTDNSISGNSAGNARDAYIQYAKELKETDYKSFINSMPESYVTIGKPVVHKIENGINLNGTCLNVIADNKIHIAITTSIVKKLSSSSRRENPACTQIVNSHFKDTIFSDLCMAVYEKMIELYRTGKMTYDRTSHSLIFSVQKKNDKEISCYIELYRAISNELSLFKTASYNDEMILDTVNKTTDIVDFTQSAQLERTITSDEMFNFMTYIQLHDDKHYEMYLNIIAGLLSGTTYKAIAEKFNLTERQVRYLKSKLEKYYETYFHGTDKFHTVKYFKYDKNGKKRTDKYGKIKEYSYKYYMF